MTRGGGTATLIGDPPNIMIGSAVNLSFNTFLLNLTQRLQTRGFSASSLVLRMTREEIGSYLGLKLETVSRAFSRFQEEGLISVQQKHVRILDLPKLKSLLAPPDGRIA